MAHARHTKLPRPHHQHARISAWTSPCMRRARSLFLSVHGGNAYSFCRARALLVGVHAHARGHAHVAYAHGMRAGHTHVALRMWQAHARGGWARHMGVHVRGHKAHVQGRLHKTGDGTRVLWDHCCRRARPVALELLRSRCSSRRAERLGVHRPCLSGRPERDACPDARWAIGLTLRHSLSATLARLQAPRSVQCPRRSTPHAHPFHRI